MNSKPTCIVVGALIGGLCLISFLNSAEPPSEIQEPPVAAAEDDIDVRYARACLDLAQLELQLMEDANRKFNRTFSLSQIERKRAKVRVAETQLYAVLKKDPGEHVGQSVFLSQAREQAELAKREYQRALETRNRDLVYSDLKLEKLRLQAEVAQLRLEIWSDPNNLLSMIDQLNWQVERLSQEVIDLQAKVDDLSRL